MFLPLPVAINHHPHQLPFLNGFYRTRCDLVVFIFI